MPAELHISSLLIHARPAAIASARSAIAALDGVEVHGANPQGKIVVTLETRDEDEIVAAMDALQRMTGVVSVALVYHQTEA